MKIRRPISIMLALMLMLSTVAGAAQYVVKEGDRLWKIAADNGTTVEAIAELNGLDNPNMIMAGQVLEMPSDEVEATPVVPSTPVEPTVAEGVVLEGSAPGYGGTLTVAVTLSGTDITAVEVTSHSETAGIGTRAIDALPAAIVAANSAEVDAVSGATVTSEAISMAVGYALISANPEEEGTGIPEDGKYTTYAQGQNGYVHVATTFSGGAIKNVEILTQHETIGIATYPLDTIPALIVEAQTTGVDNVSGATLTTNAIKQAVNKAVVEAGGNVADYSFEAPKAPVVETEKSDDVDVVIMGAGTAGLMSAARLVEEGYDVLVFEKLDIPGGSMATTYSGVSSYGSMLELEYKQIEKEDADARLAETLDRYMGSMKPEQNPTGELVFWDQVLGVSGEFVDWLHGMGVGFATMNPRIGTTPYIAPGAYQGGAGLAVEYIADRIVKMGGEIVYATPVVDLIQNDDGVITGVKAEGEDGTSWTVTADAVLLASGGFAANQEMVEQYYPVESQWAFNCNIGSTGDGINLGLKYGGTLEAMGRTLGAFLSTYKTRYELAFIHYSTPGIIVNINGDSIGNITSGNHSMLGAAKRDPANGDTFYYVIDEAARMSTKKSNYTGLSYGVSYDTVFENGEAVYYNSLEEAAADLNLPSLVETVEANNSHYMAGTADEFGRSKLPYIDDRDGVYMLRVDPTYYLTTGGLACDEDGRIITEAGEVIEGLYGAGDVLGSLQEKDGLKYGLGFDAAMMFGYIVADNIMEDIK